MSAYEILAALQNTNIKAAVQVYRALERLIAKNRVQIMSHSVVYLTAVVTELFRRVPG
jgi:Fe2+ or Zn2+ uptake regulation protein